ncbi:amino acid adenylation domain-containing protein [Amycolatopsis cynarae]|uniref:Phenyloxazoline synthase MbtB n=1 Tax=Amycolatopsis cynarae TaxID=2995223 RepID=A0ABY7B918_9PSEU|nr:amino acid adenylation domain-containing protein [Amycolatopsis sp. HUAS 11-8]WAL68646.1 amino acid adenylation domain-containing protein [Amycolatopsis sp. HUAS 11-8]
MSAAEVLRELRSRGLTITASGQDLRLQGPRERMDAELIGMVKAHKPALLSYLDTSAPFGLTALQRGYLIGREEHVEIGATASHVYHEIEGCWDLGRLEEALRSVVARHGILRTRFTDDGTQVEQRSTCVRVGRYDLRGHSAEAQQEHRRRMRDERGHRILPVDEAPLLAVDVTVLADDSMVLHVDHDGLILDAISMFLFFRQWWSAYEHGRIEDAGPEASFADYVAAQERARTRAPAERSRRYWLGRLDDLAPYPDLPLATSPSSITRPRFTARFARLDESRWTALKARAAEAGLTPSGVLLAAYAETLACWGAGKRFTLNTTVANRPPIHPRIHAALGNFGETMLVQVETEGGTFAERARAMQASLRESLDNRHFSGIEVLRELARRDAADARMPYTFNSAIGYEGADGSALELFGPETWTSSQTPQVWLDVSPFEQHGGLVVQFDSVDGLFPEGLVDALVSGYQRLLGLLLEEASWTAKLFDLLPEDQRRRRAEANDTELPVPGSQLLQDAFLARAEAAPDAPAVFTSTARITYGLLRAHAVRAAEWLRRQGVRRDEPVALVMTRGPEQVAGILAALIAGAAYLPIDAALPAERQEYLLKDSGARCVLTNAGHEDGIRAVLPLDLTGPVDPVDPAGPAEHAPGARPGDLAYVLYTSGTTGEPKGVMVTHRSVANVVADCNRRFGIGPDDRFFAISAFSFDLSVYDVFGALSAGAALVLPDAERAADPEHWLQLCGETGVSVWNSVPAIVSLLHEHAETEGAERLAALRLVMMSGDRLPPGLPAALRKLKPGLEVVSLGGPTETTIWNILHPVGEDEDGSESIPYGRPNANNRAYIVDSAGRDLPDWVTGEICAAGVGLARGYWGDPLRTAERFLDDPVRGERLYRTGDLGRYLPSGEIEILGRTDFQVKVNGYRIEAGEVETRLAALPAVRHAVVTKEAGTGGDRLAAHLVPAGGSRPTAAELGEELRRVLPHYMVPSAVYWHESLPLTRNGKVDRAKLLRWEPAETGPVVEGAAPDSELEREVAGLWAKVLKMPTEPAVTTTLFELGGDSLAAARILAGVRKRFGVTFTLDRLPEVDTVRTMAARIAAAPARKGGPR